MKKKYIKAKLSVPTSITNTVAHPAIFKPDAGQKGMMRKGR